MYLGTFQVDKYLGKLNDSTSFVLKKGRHKFLLKIGFSRQTVLFFSSIIYFWVAYLPTYIFRVLLFCLSSTEIDEQVLKETSSLPIATLGCHLATFGENV